MYLYIILASMTDQILSSMMYALIDARDMLKCPQREKFRVTNSCALDENVKWQLHQTKQNIPVIFWGFYVHVVGLNTVHLVQHLVAKAGTVTLVLHNTHTFIIERDCNKATPLSVFALITWLLWNVGPSPHLACNTMSSPLTSDLP